jgi:hypothetical protein
VTTVRARLAADTEDAQEPVGERVGEPQRRARNPHQHPIDTGGVQCHPFGLGRRVDLRRQLTEDDDDDRQQHPCERHRVALPGALREDRGDGGGEHARAGQDHEVRPQPVIGLLQQPLERARLTVAGLRAVADAEAIDREHRHLGARGERDDQEEQEQDQDQQQWSRCEVQGGPFLAVFRAPSAR